MIVGNGNYYINAGDDDDQVVVGNGNMTIDAGGGNDSIDGGDGNDVLLGGAGNDTITGGKGNDLIAGGTGKDHLEGNQGNDILFDGDVIARLADDSLVAILRDWSAGASQDSLGARMQVTFDRQSRDELFGNAGGDWFWTDDALDATDRGGSERRN